MRVARSRSEAAPISLNLSMPLVEGGGSGSRGMSAEQVALVPQCEECLAGNDPLTSHPWRLAVGETLVGRSLFRHVDYFRGPGARRRWGKPEASSRAPKRASASSRVSTPGNVALTFHSSPLSSAVTDSAPKPGARASRLVCRSSPGSVAAEKVCSMRNERATRAGS
jgi:hypothetical protein